MLFRKNKFDKFTFMTSFGTQYPNCRYTTGRYANGNLALQIENKDGPVCTCSVNPPGTALGDGEIAIKDWSENSGMGNWLKLHGVIVREDALRRIPSGYVDIPVYRLTEAGKKLFAGK